MANINTAHNFIKQARATTDVVTHAGVNEMIEVSAQYTAGYGWQYVITKGGKLFGRYGAYDTEKQALQAGHAHQC